MQTTLGDVGVGGVVGGVETGALMQTVVVLAKLRLLSIDRNTPEDVSKRGSAKVRGIAATSVLCVVAGACCNEVVTSFWAFKL